jgi:hypothetical protein
LAGVLLNKELHDSMKENQEAIVRLSFIAKEIRHFLFMVLLRTRIQEKIVLALSEEEIEKRVQTGAYKEVHHGEDSNV